MLTSFIAFFFQAEDGIRDLVRSRGLGDVYKRQVHAQWLGQCSTCKEWNTLVEEVRDRVEEKRGTPALSLIHI